jgi:hypothetical protein
MTSIDAKDAAAALSDIDDIAQRVRQSQFYQLSSLLTVWWGVLVFAANIATFLWPRWAGFFWPVMYVLGVGGSVAISALSRSRTGVRTVDVRILLAYLSFFAFGFFTCWLGHFAQRQVGTFWPIYFMLFYILAGLWVGYAFVAIGVSITALTLVGYFFVGAWFEPWMALVNGGGLILGGLWMRRN